MSEPTEGIRWVLANYRSARLAGPFTTLAERRRARQLPLDTSRAERAEGVPVNAVNPKWFADSWAASVADASAELRTLITIHDNGGTASSPTKIKDAARELLRLLGED